MMQKLSQQVVLNLPQFTSTAAWGSTLINSNCYKLVTDKSTYIPMPGDIAITEGNGTGHASIYDGSSWDADFASKNPSPGSTGAYKDKQPTIYQYIGTH